MLRTFEILVRKLANPWVAHESLNELTMIFHDAGDYLAPRSLRTEQDRQACQEAWRMFVEKNRNKLKRRAPFSVLDATPKEALFPGYQFRLSVAK